MRISNSFSEGEVQVLDFMLTTLLRGGSPSTATRHKDFASLYRKVMTMKRRIEQQEERRNATQKSSVGTVEAPEGSSSEASEGEPAGGEEPAPEQHAV